MNSDKEFQVGGVKFSAVRTMFPRPHWLVRLDETGEVLHSGAGGISNVSVPKMQSDIQELLDRVSKGDVADFRRRFNLPLATTLESDIPTLAARGHKEARGMVKSKIKFSWVGDDQKAVAFAPDGAKVAVRCGSETVKIEDLRVRLRNMEKGDDVPILMNAFGCDYDAACDVVFGDNFDAAVTMLEQASRSTVDALSTTETDNRPIAGDPRLFIEQLGYDVDIDADQEGLWVWTAPSDGCDISFSSAAEALDGAWIDAVAQTLSLRKISCEHWGQMYFDQQRVAITLALSGEIPSLSDLSPDTQMEWVSKVRGSYPDIGPKEAFRLADQEYSENDGVLPKPVASEVKHARRPRL